MKKYIAFLSVMLALLTAFLAFGIVASAVSPTAAANKLHDLGLLAGVGTKADGSINFDENGSLTRAQSITQVVRFLGKEKAATSIAAKHPFTDLPVWAVPYVGYAYENGVTKGVSNTKFDPDGSMTEAAFLTAILRVLGYNDAAGDFVWSNPYELAKQVGLKADTSADTAFTRGDAFVICYNALSAKNKTTGKTVAEELVAEGVFTMEKYNEVSSAVQKAELIAINELKQQSENGDHANDDFRSASLEINFRETTILTSQTTAETRYNNAYYPRIRKVNDNLYLLVYMYSQYGQHLYYVTSEDSITWNSPKVLWNSADYPAFTYESGELAGTQDRYHAVNPDICVLDDGSVICVYAVRAVKGYRYYPDYSGLFIKRGTVNDSGDIVWSEETKIYTGQVWEPSIIQLENGDIHVYYTQVAPDIMEFGYDEEHRSTETGLIISNDNGNTWTPDIKAGDKNYYRALAVFREYVGDKDGRPHYNGQMPVVTELSNGKLMIVTEVKQLDGKFRISYNVSEEEGTWKNLANNEESAYENLTIPPNSSPYIDRFISGEVYITHNAGGSLVGRLAAADGSEVGGSFKNAPGSAGMWGSCAIVDTHRAITAMHHKVSDNMYGVGLYYSYLNHRVNAPKATVTVDGYTDDWEGNNDALFVGSETQAQATLRTAHDEENVYFLISRLDYYLTSGDTATVCIGATDTSDYRITVNLDGNVTVDYYANGMKKNSFTLDSAAVTLLGTVNNNDDKDEGAIIELKVPKAKVELLGKTSFPVRLALANDDGNGTVNDTFTGASAITTKLWPKVVLD